MPDFKVPYLRNIDIESSVNNFLDQHQVQHSIPFDVELFTEQVGIEIIPIMNLEKDAKVFAMLSADLKSIIIDTPNFTNIAYEKKIRFDIAHELGHYCLHGDFYKEALFDDRESYDDFHKSMGNRDYKFFEYQANTFAGQLLVPKTELDRCCKEKVDEINGFLKEHPEFGIRDVASLIASDIANEFNVSDSCIVTRLNNTHSIKNVVDLRES